MKNLFILFLFSLTSLFVSNALYKKNKTEKVSVEAIKAALVGLVIFLKKETEKTAGFVPTPQCVGKF